MNKDVDPMDGTAAANSFASASAAETRQAGVSLVPFVAPLAAFFLLTALEGQEWAKPYYAALYPLKLVVVVALLVKHRRAYPAFSARGIPLALAVGALGCVAWVLLSRIDLAAYLPESVASWLIGKRANFAPDLATLGDRALLAVRLLGLALVVPLAEEIFWRGFLLRYLVRDDFESVPIGTYAPFSFWVVTLLFTAVHPEILAAFVWGAAINLLCYRTRNLWACVVAHAVTNALLGAYILTTGDWRLW